MPLQPKSFPTKEIFLLLALSLLIPGSAAGAGRWLQITSFELGETSVTVGTEEVNLPITVYARNLGPASNAIVRIDLIGPDGIPKQGVLYGEVTDLGDSEKPVPIDPLTINKSWKQGNWVIRAVVLDSVGVEHGSKTRYLTVNHEKPTPVPELDLLLLPFIAFAVLAIIFLESKRRS